MPSKIDLDTKNWGESVLRGKAIFRKENCNHCHLLGKKHYNMLQELRQRREKKFIYQFIRNQDSLLASKHPVAIALKEEYNGVNGLHNKKHLTKSQIQDLLNFIASYD